MRIGRNALAMRRNFARGLAAGLWVAWPILSGLAGLIAALGLVVGLIEKWSVQDALYFAFVSGLTIGYGDLVPTTAFTRMLAIVIGLCGVMLTGIVVAIAVKALNAVSETKHDEDEV